MSKKMDRVRLNAEVTRRVEAETHARLLEGALAVARTPPPAPAAVAPPPPAPPKPPTFRDVRDAHRAAGQDYLAADVVLQSLPFGGLDAPVPAKVAS